MIKFLIEDGNLKEWVRISLVVTGIILVVIGVILGINSIIGCLFFLAGFPIAAIGGYASQAHTLRIKPFDNSYKKARDSYNEKNN